MSGTRLQWWEVSLSVCVRYQVTMMWGISVSVSGTRLPGLCVCQVPAYNDVRYQCQCVRYQVIPGLCVCVSGTSLQWCEVSVSVCQVPGYQVCVCVKYQVIVCLCVCVSGTRLRWCEGECGVSASVCCHWINVHCQSEGHQLLVSDVAVSCHVWLQHVHFIVVFSSIVKPNLCTSSCHTASFIHLPITLHASDPHQHSSSVLVQLYCL